MCCKDKKIERFREFHYIYSAMKIFAIVIQNWVSASKEKENDNSYINFSSYILTQIMKMYVPLGQLSSS